MDPIDLSLFYHIRSKIARQFEKSAMQSTRLFLSKRQGASYIREERGSSKKHSLGKDFSVTAIKTLLSLKKGESATVSSVSAQDKTFRRLLDMGCIPGTPITMLGEAPFGGMRAYRICGAIIAIREVDADKIHILVENE